MDHYFSCSFLAYLKMPGYPTSRQGWDKLVKESGWKYREVRGRGRGGVRLEYQPPPDVYEVINKKIREELPSAYAILDEEIKNSEVKALIESRQRGELNAVKEEAAPAVQKMMAMSVAPGAQSHSAEVMESLLVVCLKACAKVYGEPFQAQDAAIQLGYAADLYNLLVRMSVAMGGNMELMQRLEADGISQQLQLFIKIGQARKFPPPPDFMSVVW